MGAIFLIVFEHSFTMIGRIIVANRFVGYLNIRIKINIPVFMVLFWGVRPKGVITSLPFLLPIGVELFLDASSAPSAVLTAFSLDLSFLESFFPAVWAALLFSSQSFQ